MQRLYQPSLLRLLHGATAAIVGGSWISGLLIYSSLDGRWGRLPFRTGGEWVDLHGSLGVGLVLVFTLFAPYALTLGRPRLARGSNALALAALTLAIGTGLFMKEDAMREGELGSPVYGLHLSAWLLVTLALILHVGGALRRGGCPLARSMFSLTVRSGDRPGDWPMQLKRFFRRSS
jgi:hypothetical protein